VRRRGWAAGLGLALVACGPGIEAPADVTGPLTALPACDPAPAPLGADPDDGVVLPDGAVLVEQTEVGPTTSAAAYVGLTPIQVRLAYEELDGRDGLTVLSSEDEVFESELLLASAERRTFVRATATCDRGSNLLVIAAPADAAGAVPAPQGDGTVTE
jgi:hypothetical protein